MWVGGSVGRRERVCVGGSVGRKERVSTCNSSDRDDGAAATMASKVLWSNTQYAGFPRSLAFLCLHAFIANALRI